MRQFSNSLASKMKGFLVKFFINTMKIYRIWAKYKIIKLRNLNI